MPAFAPLLASLNLAGAVVTVDALQTHPEAAEFLVAGKQAHYLFTVKANQPTLLARHPPAIRRWRTVTVYAITSLGFAQASPARLADLIRGHWAIENGCTTSAT